MGQEHSAVGDHSSGAALARVTTHRDRWDNFDGQEERQIAGRRARIGTEVRKEVTLEFPTYSPPGRGSKRLVAVVLLTLLVGSPSLACGRSQPADSAVPGGQSTAAALPVTTVTSVVGPGESDVAWGKSSAQEMGLTDLPDEMPQDFWFGFRYSSGSTRYLEVRPRADRADYEGTYRQGSADGPVTWIFSREEIQDVYSRVRAVHFLRYPVVFGPTGSAAASDTKAAVPGEGYVLAVGYGEVEHSVSWFDDGQSRSADAVALRDLFGYIEDLVAQKLK